MRLDNKCSNGHLIEIIFAINIGAQVEGPFGKRMKTTKEKEEGDQAAIVCTVQPGAIAPAADKCIVVSLRQFDVRQTNIILFIYLKLKPNKQCAQIAVRGERGPNAGGAAS